MTTSYEHWHLNKDDDRIVWLTFDKAGSQVNTLDSAAITELDQIIDGIIADKQCRGLIIKSAKKGFIAGANIKSFLQFKNEEQVFAYLREVQSLFSKIASLNMPTVAMINGHCLGGGLELALSCHYRVAVASDKKEIGFPEILLGIFPAWGGTVRSTRKIGLIKALPLILQGSSLHPQQMQKMGLIDVVQPQRFLEQAARAIVLKPPKQVAHLRLSNCRFMRNIIAYKARRRLADKFIKEAHYPAPYAAIRYLQQTPINHQEAFALEAKVVANLAQSTTAHNLIRLFFLRDRLKKLAKNSAFKAQHVHVIGAGTMGADIAAWCAVRGMMVTLQDIKNEFLAKALARIQQNLLKAFKESKRVQMVMDRLIPDSEGLGIAKADVIIEAVVEEVTIKQQLFKDIGKKAHRNAIIASNTSSIPLEMLTAGLDIAPRVIGLHFFSPVTKTQLVEVVSHAANDQDCVNNALAFVGQMAKLPVPVRSGPAFLVNRLLMPYLMQAFRLFEEGIAPATIDKLALDFGMPMGPVTLADRVGLDVCLHIVENVGEQLGLTAPAKLKEMVAKKQLGIKTGRGFYQYRHGKSKRVRYPQTIPNQALMTDRLFLPLLNEAMHCLNEGIVSDADLIDAAMVFAAGFAPFRGGPMRYAKTRGVNDIIIVLKRLKAEFDDPFEISPAWQQFERLCGD